MGSTCAGIRMGTREGDRKLQPLALRLSTTARANLLLLLLDSHIPHIFTVYNASSLTYLLSTMRLQYQTVDFLLLPWLSPLWRRIRAGSESVEIVVRVRVGLDLSPRPAGRLRTFDPVHSTLVGGSLQEGAASRSDLPIKIPADQIATMASRHLAAPVPAPDAAPGAPKLGTKRKEPEPEPDRQDEAYLLAESLSSAAAAANRPQSIPPPVVMDVDEEEDRELAEWIRMAATAEEDEGDDEDSRELAEWWMAAAADEQLALIHEWQAKLGRITPAPDDLEPYDDLDPERFDYLDSSVLRPEGCEENESKRRLGRDGLVRYLD